MAKTTHHCQPFANRIEIPGTDLVIQIELNNDELCMTVNKAQTGVYRVVLEQATGPIEHVWLADMFMHDDRVQLGQLSAEVSDYVDSLNIAQG